MIDFHTHLIATPIEILTYMDYFNIDLAVVLSTRKNDPKVLVDLCSKYPNRLVPFCTVDVEHESKIEEKIEELVNLGCKGYGEHKVKLRIDDPRAKKIYRACGKLGIPVLVHLGWKGNGWNLDIDGFKKVSQEFPETIFVAHGEGWWREISSEVPPVAYPTGKVKPGGKVEQILEECPNVYADISAWSGSNALSRDLEFARKFVRKFRDRLLFGTDFYQRIFKPPLLIYTPFKVVENLNLDEDTYRAITHENALKILKM